MADVSSFKGLSNVSDPLRAGLNWFAQADNVNITDTGAVARRDGYSEVQTGSFSSVYTTIDFQRMYLVDGMTIRTFEGAVVATLTSSAPVYWTEANDQVFYNNGTDAGIIAPDHSVTQWRRAITVNEYLGADGNRLAALLDPMPLGTDVVQEWKGRMYAVQYFPSEDQSVIWFSQPLGFHLFSLDSDYFIVPGHVHMLARTDDALIVGTNKRIYAYTGDKLDQLADYGVVPGVHWSMDGARVLFWTTRGVCAALPFTNLTERNVSVAPGVSAGGCVVRSHGQKRYVVALHQGVEAFNAYP